MNSKAIVINGYPFVPYETTRFPVNEMVTRSGDFYQWLNARRSVRHFSHESVPFQVIENILRSAGTAPSGAHKQPWTFCVVTNPKLKKEIRLAAEKEEQESYDNRMGDEWLDAIKPLQTDWSKPFIETAPYLIIVFKKAYDILPSGEKRNNYYVNQSVGIACGMLLAAIHHAGLAALTHTPSPMNFLTKILRRPENERPFLLIPVGYPAKDALVPDLKRKSLDEMVSNYN